MSVTVYGASDDLIVVDGALSTTFVALVGNPGNLFAFSDGTLLRMTLDAAGDWRIEPVVRGVAFIEVMQATSGGGSDVAHLRDVGWVVRSTELKVAPDGPQQARQQADRPTCCRHCQDLWALQAQRDGAPASVTLSRTMTVCDVCGSKRCQQASDHREACTAVEAS